MYEFVRTFRFVAYVHKVKTIDKKLEESEKVRKDIEEQMSQLRTETAQQVGNVLFFFTLRSALRVFGIALHGWLLSRNDACLRSVPNLKRHHF